ncbi:uncharacterized protein IL334_006450 [Kwoniella shivajii]|uniref:Uncharacterized protein n=1 Tax=Kwoniella shivajii TaxID=564305 RepID=A0ABZ1D7L4_9TREE|nr:hypothetical protein IL334_006450 [Kwoniella shivajii]
MPPNPAPLPAPTAQVGLQEWLKLLTARGVDMRIAMGLAAKIYKSHGTIERLGSITPQKLAGLIEDKEARKTVSNAIRGLASGEAVSKKRGRDSDLLEPLPNKKGAEDNLPLDIDFHPILDVEELLPLTLTTNRAPVSTAWAFTISRKLGFDVAESLSIAHVYVHISSLKHALMLGNILGEEETREAREEIEELPGGEKDLPSKLRKKEVKGKGRNRFGRKDDEKVEIRSHGSAQPWIGIMRAKPILERPDGTIRAIEKGVPVGPGQAYLYITRAFKDYTSHVMGALKLVADSYEADELNRMANFMYNDFKPDVVEWGQKGTLELARVLEQVKSPVDIPKFDENDENDDVENYPVKSDPSDIPSSPGGLKSELASSPPFEQVEGEQPNKKVKRELTVEEYEALLDADGPGGFMEGGDIYGAEP